MADRLRVSSGVSQLDRLLEGLYIGDNVVWLDDAGSLAGVFSLNFLQASLADGKPLFYVTFDRSPKNLLDRLGPLAESPHLTVLDCFTWGKGAGSEIFQRFYSGEEPPVCRVLPVDRPGSPQALSDVLYAEHAKVPAGVDARYVFESLTGMSDLWGGEEAISTFYAHTCPRLYEMNTVAYWVMEKKAHSSRLRAQISQVAQVVVDLNIKRGTTSLTVLKAEDRDPGGHHKPHTYWARDLNVQFDDERRAAGHLDLGLRLKELRTKKGLSQTDLAKLVGVTPSTISQVESNLIYPSLPALLKMAEVLGVGISSFFSEGLDQTGRLVFPAGEAVPVRLGDMPEGKVNAVLLTPVDFESKGEPYLIEMAPEASLSSHFFVHKGEEMGYLLSGRLQLKFKKQVQNVKAGDLVYLTTQMPTGWTNPGRTPAKLLWIKFR